MPYTWPVTLAETKSDLNLTTTTNDAELQTVIDAATAILENHPAYTVVDNVKQTSHTEWYDTADTIALKHYPVASITSITGWSGATSQVFTAAAWDSGLTPDFGYAFDAASGLLHLSRGGLSSTHWQGRVLVTYTSGVTTVPADIRAAALLLVEHLWETQRGTGGSAPPAGLDPDETQLGFGTSVILPNRVREVLAPYERTPAVA